ncbi:hypothetical protein [uncultured Kordia sp.]|uniref:hypothetical protein n=1 Tax=uncultured Kordia sp. TaxID=507699 RepID=UPI0026142CC4|nr:hypothetical protein [uncultured Kordia sp.]
MLKSILKIDGVNELKKEDQLRINGGENDPCESFHYICSTADNYSECMNAFFCSDYKHPIILTTKWIEDIF